MFRAVNNVFLSLLNEVLGQDSSVGTSTRYRLHGPRIESGWEARFSVPVQAGPAVHPASYKMDTWSFAW